MSDYPCHIVRTKRKTISLRILENGVVEIRCPLSTEEEYINYILKTHRHWIEKKRKEMISRPQFHGRLEENYPLFYLGKAYPLHFGPTTTVQWDGKSFLLPEKKKNTIQRVMETWYRQQAKKILVEKVEYYAQKYGFSYTGIRLSSASKRYGSCSAKNLLSFTWKLILLPEDLIDYIVIHELAHTQAKHHQQAFWKIVHDLL
ncbi:MAG: M48 family metallopeptidase, partial [Brevinematales bacterium]